MDPYPENGKEPSLGYVSVENLVAEEEVPSLGVHMCMYRHTVDEKY